MSGTRDDRLDFWRGLCLVDMVLVHLVYEGLWLGGLGTRVVADWTRFAAGGFVLVAGLGVATVFLEGARDPRRRRETHRRLWRRAGQLLGVHYAAASAFVLVDTVLGRREPVTDAVAFLADLALLREQPPYGDILPLYVLLLAATPVMLGLLRRDRAGWLVLASAAAFALGTWQPGLLVLRAGESFPVLLWQAPFVAGLLVGGSIPRWDAAMPASRHRTLAALGVAAALLSWIAHAPPFGADAAWQRALFEKTPLGAGELVRYLALTLAVLLGAGALWPRLAERRAARAVALLGRHSLAVYVAHVFVQAVLLAFGARLGLLGRFDAAMAILALAILLGVAALARAWKTSDRGALPALRGALLRLRGFAAPPSGLAVASACGLVLALLAAPPGRVDEPASSAPGQDEADPMAGSAPASLADAESAPAADGANAPLALEPAGVEAAPGMPPAQRVADFDSEGELEDAGVADPGEPPSQGPDAGWIEELAPDPHAAPLGRRGSPASPLA